MISIDSKLPDENGESPANLNESENVYRKSKDVSYETDFYSIFWGMLNRDSKASMKSVLGSAGSLNETLIEKTTEIDGVSTELKTDVPEVEKLINAGKKKPYKCNIEKNC